MSDAKHSPTPPLLVVVLLVAVVVAGVLVRPLAGLVGDVAGGVLYTVAVGLVIALLQRRTRPLTAAAVAVAISWLVEGLQATGIATAAARRFPPARLMLGTTFVWWDLPAYVLGGVVVYAMLRSIRRVGSSHGAAS